MKKINTKIYEIIFLFLLSLTPFLWLKPNQLILGHDSGFRLNPVDHIGNLFYSWSANTNFGVDWSFFKGFLITQFPEAFFTYITHSLRLGQEITLVMWFFLMVISMYVCLNGIFPEKKHYFIRVSSSILYSFNFFVLQGWFIAERAKFSAYAALPLGFLILYNTFQRKYTILKGTVLFSFVFFFLNGGGNPSLYGGILLTYGITCFYFLVREYQTEKVVGIRYFLKVGLSFLAAVVLVNAYWIIPQIYLALHSFSSHLSDVGGPSGIIAWENVISKNASLLNLFRLQGIPDWYDNPSHPYANYFISNPILIILSGIPLLIILYGLFIGNLLKNKQTRPFYKILLILFISSFAFAGGTHYPLGILYSFLIAHLSGFVIFRSSYYKFSPALFFASSILIGCSFSLLIEKMKKKRQFIFGLLIIVSILLYHFPYYISNFFAFSNPFTTRITIPIYAKKMFFFINRHVDHSSRILLLPELDPTFVGDGYTWGYWSLDILPRIAIDNPILASDGNDGSINEMYKAIKDNDGNKFLQLARITGTQKILWRNDVLFNDRATTGVMLMQEENNLKRFPGVHLEKSSKPWKLYSIDVKNNIFSTTPYVYSYTGNKFNLSDAFDISRTPAEKTSWITQPEINSSIMVDGSVVRDNCSVCDLKLTSNEEPNLTLPNIHFVPWSKFYFFIAWQEREELAMAQGPDKKIDIDLDLSTKRLVEMWAMTYKYYNSNPTLYIHNNTKRYETTITNAINNLNTIRRLDVQKENYYALRIISFILSQKKFIDPFQYNNDRIQPDIKELESFMDSKIAVLSQQLWLSSSNEDRKSYLSIDQSGFYDMRVIDDVHTPFTLYIDNKEVQHDGSVFLAKGLHRVRTLYANLNDYVRIDNSSPLKLLSNIPAVFKFNNFTSNVSYIVSFSYMIKNHNEVSFFISQNNTQNNLSPANANALSQRLINDGKSHQFSFIYNPHDEVDKASIAFASDKGSMIDIQNFSFQRVINSRIYAILQKNNTATSSPEITYREINPTKYKIEIKNAQKPFLFIFNQAYNPSWKLTVVNEKGSFGHVEVNGYANGWYLTKTGSYSVLVEYQAQNVFYVGIVVSVLSLSGCGMYFLKKKYEKSN